MLEQAKVSGRRLDNVDFLAFEDDHDDDDHWRLARVKDECSINPGRLSAS